MRALGIDYGKRRTGLALSDPTGLLARPWKAIDSGVNLPQLASALVREIVALRAESDGLDVVVIGLPRRLSGDPNEMTAAARGLASALEPLIDVPIVLQDERLSSREAEDRLAAREKDWRKRKLQIDAASAAIILQDYLDGQPRRAQPPHDGGDADYEDV